MPSRIFASLLVLVAFFAFVPGVSADDGSWYFISATNPTVLTSPTQMVAASFSLSRLFNSSTYPYYYLVADATLGSHDLGMRKLFLGGDQNDDSISIYLRPRNEETEIGVDNVAGSKAVSGVLSGSSSSVAEFDVALGLPVGLLGDGTYSNTFTFNLYTNRSAGTSQPLVPPNGEIATRLIGTRSINVSATLNLSSVTLTLAPTDISFGTNLVDGGTYQTSNVVLTAQATRRFNLHVNSQNSGTIRLLTGDETIPYVFTFDEVVVNLSAGTVLLKERVNRGTRNYSMNFRLENLPFVEGGNYRDVLTFFITIP